MPSFRTVIDQPAERNVMGIIVPEDIVAVLGKGKRPPVTVTIKGHSYRSTVAVMNGLFMLPLSQENRAPMEVKGGDEVDVTVELDDQPRTVEVPDDLAEALGAAGLRERFDALAFTYRKEHVRSVLDAKTAETRARRVAKAVETVGSK